MRDLSSLSARPLLIGLGILGLALVGPGCSSGDLSLTGGGGASVTTTAHGGGGSGGAPLSTTTTGAGLGGSGGAPPVNNGFPDHWQDGLDCASESEVQIWQYAPDTYILRQSLCTNFEGPFVYVLFGEDKVLVQDTGTGSADIATPVMGLVDDWLAMNGKPSIDVVVTHSHSHGDHVGGDSQFAGLPNVTVVGKSVSDVQGFFGFSSWPGAPVTYSLGGRDLIVFSIPGHQAAHVALYDPTHHLLFTGDTLYPGRLYVNDWPAYVQSLSALKNTIECLPPDCGLLVDWVLGTHIEMSTSGDDYPMGADQHPDEHVLQLPYSVFQELQGAVEAMGNSPQYQAHQDFIIYPL